MVDKLAFETCFAVHCRNVIALLMLLLLLSFFITSALILDASGQVPNDPPCEPMMKNATIPSASENVLPPEIYMIYREVAYLGELSESIYREGETFSDLNIPPVNISSDLPTESVEIESETCAQFLVRGTPRTLPPDSLDISAYTMDGTAVGVLNATEDNTSTFRIDLPKGKYILLATATWIPSNENEYVTGYVIYKFLTNIA
jgi:hypothetical protein